MSHRVLETDFPLMVPPNPPNMIRSHSRDRNTNSNSLHRNSQHTSTAERKSSGGGGPPPYHKHSVSSTMTSSAVDWHYQRHQEQQEQEQQKQQQQRTSITTTTYGGGTLGRSGSLRKAYSESSSGPEDDHRAETEPLFQQHSHGKKSQGTITIGVSSGTTTTRPSPVRSQMSTTSDYHSDPHDGATPPTTAGVVVMTSPTATDSGSNGAFLRNSGGAPSQVKTAKRHRKHDDDSMSACARCWFGLLVLVAQILLNGVMGLILYWVIKYHSKDNTPFAWKSDPKLEFNLHPVLMVAGFIYFMGQSMLMYRTCRCCRRIWNKLLHTIFHILAIPCVVIGFIAVLDSHNLRTDKDGNNAPIPNFYSLHSWIGLTVMGLFALQFVVGFFSFLLLLCCESATASFRASLVPIHATFGVTTFVLAVAAACTGLTEKAFFTLSTRQVDDDENVVIKSIGDKYTDMVDEGIVINSIGAALVALAILIPWILGCGAFRKGLKKEGGRYNSDI